MASPSASESGSDPAHELAPDGAPRRLGLTTATLLVMASMVGTGVFTTSGLLLRDLRSAPAVLLAWALGGVLAMTGALSYAELVAAMPKNGGEYTLIGAAYHPSLGFASGFVSFVVGFSAPIAASALAFGNYLHAVFPSVPVQPAALLLVLAMCGVHGAHVGLGHGIQNVTTVFKVLLIVAFIAAGAGLASPERLAVAEQPLLDASLSPSFAVGLIFVTFSYSGWNAATYIAGEVKDPRRTLPIALLVGTAAVTLLYVAINAVFVAAAPMDELSGVVEVGHVAATHLFGTRAGAVMSLIIALGLVSTVGALIMTGTRVLEAMGRDHGPIALLARRATGGGPFVAVLLQGGVAVVLVLTMSFDVLLGYIGFTLSLFAALTVFGVIVMRVRAPDLPRPYRAWGYPLTPLLFVALMGWMIVRSIAEAPIVALFGGGTIAIGLALYGIVRVTSRD